MTHIYKITGIATEEDRAEVEEILNSISGLVTEVTLDPPEATIRMEQHVSTDDLQRALSAVGSYTIQMISHSSQRATLPHSQHHHNHTARVHHAAPARNPAKVSGKYYCPMHCEEDKLYDKPGNCPVCGMNLEKVPEINPI